MNRLLSCLVALFAASAFAAEPVCERQPSNVPLERRLRQLTLDLLQRPPTLAEYRFFQAKGAILDEDINELMRREEFYTRMKDYHRALLRSNISVSVSALEGDTRIPPQADGMRPLSIRGNPAGQLRGQIGQGCDAFVMQDDCNASREDPHLEPAVKTCRDAMGVPMPVSVDYNTTANYQCTRLTLPDAGTPATTCDDAIAKGYLPARYLYFCDMRRLSNGTLAPFSCRPDPTKLQTAALTNEEEDGDGRVVAFSLPQGLPAQPLMRLERCSLTMNLTGGIRGRYAVPVGCLQKEGVVDAPAPVFDTSGATTVKMCAIQAQTRAANPWTMDSCETARFSRDRTCGCGVGARRCDTVEMFNQRVASLSEEPIVLADSVVRRGEDYFSTLTTKRSFVNGTLSQMFREQQNTAVWAVTAPAGRDAIPDVPAKNVDQWVEYTRANQHSGVLTTPAWLYRFPTQRARVAQFWESFLCKSFAPPPGATVPPPEDSCNRENNLSKRCGCSYCHATIEPTGAHWGRYGERNAQFLSPDTFPKLNQKCRDCALAGNTSCDNECGNYVMQAFDGDGAASLGLLRTYLYRTADEEANIVAGPQLLVERSLATGDLEKCAVRNVWHSLLGRAMNDEEERMYMKPLADDFAMHHHDMKQLVLRIVRTDSYWRVD